MLTVDPDRRRCLLGFAAMLMLVGACKSPAERQAQQRQRTDEQAAAEIDRICALPPDQRDAKLKKIEKESGVILYCGQ